MIKSLLELDWVIMATDIADSLIDFCVINFIRSEDKEIQKHLIKIGPFTLLLVFAGQNILYTYVHISD